MGVGEGALYEFDVVTLTDPEVGWNVMDNRAVKLPPGTTGTIVRDSGSYWFEVEVTDPATGDHVALVDVLRTRLTRGDDGATG